MSNMVVSTNTDRDTLQGTYEENKAYLNEELKLLDNYSEEEDRHNRKALYDELEAFKNRVKDLETFKLDKDILNALEKHFCLWRTYFEHVTIKDTGNIEFPCMLSIQAYRKEALLKQLKKFELKKIEYDATVNTLVFIKSNSDSVVLKAWVLSNIPPKDEAIFDKRIYVDMPCLDNIFEYGMPGINSSNFEGQFIHSIMCTLMSELDEAKTKEERDKLIEKYSTDDSLKFQIGTVKRNIDVRKYLKNVSYQL